MFSKIILCVSAKQLTAGIWRMGNFVSCTQYENNEAGLAKFKLFISSRRNSPIHIIIDAVEEDYRIDTMPHTSGKARNEMLQRKLVQIYRNAPYRTGFFIGREKEKRRDDRFLMMALTNADILTPWINIIDELEAPVAGAYMMPMVTQLLVKALKLKQPHLLMMTRQSSGLRQTYIADQTPRLSRLNPATNIQNDQLNRLYLSETEKTRLYLVSLRMITRETPLHLVYPVTQDLQFDLTQELQEQQGVSAEVISLPVLAKKVGLKAELLSRHPDLLHMHILARSRVSTNLLQEPQIKQYRLLQTKFGLNATSAAIVGFGTLLTFSTLYNTFDIKQQTENAIEQTKIQEKLYHEVSMNFPKTPVPGNDLKTAVELAEKLDQIRSSPEKLMQIVSQELEKQPELMLNRIRWKYTEDSKVSDDLPGGRRTNAEPNQFEPVPPIPPSGLYEIGFVDGEIRNFSGDYRGALESVSTFANNLKQNPSVAQVRITLQPVNTSSQISLQGSTLDQQSQRLDPALFQIKVILKAETPKPAVQETQVKP